MNKRNAMLARTPFNQMQLGRQITSSDYGAGNMDPHQMGYLGQTLNNKSTSRNKKTANQKKRGSLFTRLGNGNFPDYPES